MRVPRRRPYCGAYVSCTLAVVLALLAPAPVRAEPPPRSIVVLVDASTSMDDVMPTVHAALGDLVGALRPGDQCAVFAFGDQVRRVADTPVHDAEARNALRARIADLQPTDRFTDITTALQRGIAHLRRRAQSAPEHVPMLLLLTDGRHNPANAADSPSWEAVAEVFDDFQPGTHWFMHYLVLRADAVDEHVMSFVERVNGAYSLADGKAALSQALLAMPTPVHAEVTDAMGQISIRPAEAPAWTPATVGDTAGAGDVVETRLDARAVLAVGERLRVGLEYGAAVEIATATWDPFQNTGEVRLRLLRGVAELATRQAPGTWNVAVDTPSGSVWLTGTRVRLSVDPVSRAVDVAVRGGEAEARAIGAQMGVRCGRGESARLGVENTVSGPTAISAVTNRMSEVWDAVLQTDRSLAAAGPAFVAAAWSSLAVRLGPITPGGRWQQDEMIVLAGLDAEQPAAPEAEVTAALPEGLDLKVRLTSPAAVGPHMVAIRAWAAPAFVPDPAAEYAADVALVYGGRSLATFPVVLWTRDATPVALDTPVAGETTSGWAVIIGFAVVSALAVVLVYGVGGGGIGVQRQAAPGRLLVVENAAPDEMRVDFIRLTRWAHYGRERPISVGRSQYCDIVLPHGSVEEHHCNLRLVRSRRACSVQVEPVKGRPVTVSEETLTSGAGYLIDREQMGIGGFVLQYEDSSAKPQVLVHLASGETVRGALHSWDMSAPHFSLAPDDPDVKLPGGPIPDVPFAGVQDVAMLSMTGGKRRTRRGKGLSRVTVEFPRGRTVRGSLWADYASDAPLFSLFPDEQPDVDYLVVVRANTVRIERDGRPEPAGDPLAE